MAALAAPYADLGADPLRVFDLVVHDGRVAAESRVLKVRQGERVELRWRADVPLVLHLHGYDQTFTVSPGVVTVGHVDAHASGRFPVAVHGQEGGHGHATLLYLEVHPD